MKNILPGDYIAGFVDGEGCFALKFRRDVRHDREKQNGTKPVYFYWDIEFAIMLKKDDKEILEKIKNTLDCGNVNNSNKRGMVRYAVSNVDDLINKIIPFFEKHPLHTKKRFDFQLWKGAVKIFKRNQRIKLNRIKGEKGFHKINWNSNDLKKLKEIHEKIQKYKNSQKVWKWSHFI